jgi:hypothetical protein
MGMLTTLAIKVDKENTHASGCPAYRWVSAPEEWPSLRRLRQLVVCPSAMQSDVQYRLRSPAATIADLRFSRFGPSPALVSSPTPS